MASISEIKSQACASGIGRLSNPVQLLQTIGQLEHTRASEPIPPPESTLLNGLQAYWNMDEETGDSYDSVAEAFTLADVGGVTQASGPGGIGLSRHFNGTTQYMLAANSPIYASTPMTINIWVRSQASGRMYIAKDDFENGERDFDIYSTGSTLQQYVFFAGDFELNEPAVSLDDSNWHMITAMWTGTQMVLWIDGIVGPFVSATTLAFTPATNPLSVGARYRESSLDFDSPLFGDIALLGFWNRALTEAEMIELYNGSYGLTYAEL
jgi:hypothetical protein